MVKKPKKPLGKLLCLNSPIGRRFLSMRELMLTLNISSRTTVYQQVNTGQLPRPVRIGRKLLWDSVVIENLFDSLNNLSGVRHG